jgi:hypothetical protein
MTTHAENPADLGHCRHCGKPPFPMTPGLPAMTTPS